MAVVHIIGYTCTRNRRIIVVDGTRVDCVKCVATWLLAFVSMTDGSATTVSSIDGSQ